MKLHNSLIYTLLIFTFKFIEQEIEDATTEILEIPDLIEDIELAKQDIEKGELTHWPDIRTVKQF